MVDVCTIQLSIHGGEYTIHSNSMDPDYPNSHRIHVWYIYLHEWLIFMVHVGKYTIHGSYGIGLSIFFTKNQPRMDMIKVNRFPGSMVVSCSLNRW